MAATDADLQEFTRQLPKIELHAHLSGSISRECLHQIFVCKRETQPELDLIDPIEAIPPSKVDYHLSTFFPLFSKYIYKLCSDLPSIRTSTLAVLADFAADNIVYLELRTTPRAIPTYSISKRRYVQTVLSCIEDFERQSRSRMHTKLILSIDRRNTLKEAEEVVNIAVSEGGRGIVGIDLCGDPSVGPIGHLGPAFVKAKAAGLKLTLHFAENLASSNDEELQTLLDWSPDRLGHVIHVNDAFKRIIVSKNIGVELCLSCNVHASMITGTFSDHHFGWWQQNHLATSLCTDDIGVFCSPLSNEYFLAAEHFNLTKTQLRELSENVIEMTFGNEDEKQRLKKIYADWIEP